MYFLNNIANPIYFILFCNHILKTESLYQFYSDLNFFHSNYTVILSHLHSKFRFNLPSLDDLFLYSGRFKSSLLKIDALVSDFFEDFNNIMNKSSTLIHLPLDVSTWGTTWHKWIFGTFHSNKLCLKFNAIELDYVLQNEIYGQHIAVASISKFLKKHLNCDFPEKPLILSFHGPAGTGKTYISKMIANNLFDGGYKSKFVHVYHGSLDFPCKEKVEEYRVRLLHEINLVLHICERSLFIFDDIDNMVPGVIDILMSFLTFDERGSDGSVNKAIFIFLSNTGSNEISELTYEDWLDGLSREDMILDNFSTILKDIAYSEHNGLQHSEVVKKNLIDAFIPFLPMEQKHVQQCIINEFKLQNLPVNIDLVKKVASQFVYFPAKFEAFSASGCKKVSHKVDLYGNNEI